MKRENKRNHDFNKLKIVLLSFSFLLLLLCLLVIFLFGIMHWDAAGIVGMLWTKKRILFLDFFGITGLLLFVYLFQKAIMKLGQSVRRILFAVLILAAVFVQFFLILRYEVQLGWDNTSTLTSAISIIKKEPALFDQNYFEIYNNQRCFLVVTTFLTGIAGLLGISFSHMPLFLAFVSAFFMDISMYFVYLTIKELWGKAKAEKMLIWILINPGIYLWCAYYYTINLSLFTMAATVYWIIKGWKGEGKLSQCVLLGMFAMFGIQFRATLVIVLIGALLMAFFYKPENVIKKAGGVAAGAVLMSILLSATFTVLVPVDGDKAFPVSHWIMMGAQGVGTYNDEDVFYTASWETKESRNEADISRLKGRLSEMGMEGILKLTISKMTHNWGYGSHEYKPEFQYYDGLYDRLWGTKREGTLCYEQIYHLTLLLLIMLSLCSFFYQVIKTKMMEDMVFLPFITLLGGILFYILWETNPYYSVGFLGIMLICIMDGAEAFEKATDHILYSGSLPKAGAKWCPAVLEILCLLCIGYGIVSGNRLFSGEEIPVVTQNKINDVLYFNGEEEFVQTFVANRNFNSIELWLTKEKRKEDSGGIYEISIMGEDSGLVFQETIYNQDVFRTIDYIRQFEEVSVKGEEVFTIRIKTIKDDPENRMGISYYNLPVDTYRAGELAKDGERFWGDFMFNISLRNLEE